MSMPSAVVDIVDDNVYVLRTLGRVLSSHGYRVCMFTSPEQYLRTVEEGKASCVVIDICLGGSMSGLDLGRAILSSRRAIPIVFITGSPDTGIREQALAMGCVAFLEKPVPSELLIDAILKAGASSSWRLPPGPGR
jgi:FixJ family two-component response regulator